MKIGSVIMVGPTEPMGLTDWKIQATIVSTHPGLWLIFPLWVGGGVDIISMFSLVELNVSVDVLENPSDPVC